ncbi:ABC transporter ATP-binding protein [Lacticaseibacillus chiayiensis]|uniref:ABC transporter ATP-binding protein n=1 Tax=Lacticaseibacillus chiayiensis TaxID=2100821 RepID=A0A4Q1TIP7_9LACO|nr:ABC transporter ATP-binding protein [Lacticaseibacillus chiayiensis]QVI35124.1 ABC transporter ATP-binding protein [Lacticaseibacillus chiayiensis]RXT17981.1 ABC transporter ATP-binding protein [Lacticaseibacillus chiayiensis]RXT56791.1 ABC transporter ATP-binding protein [Lacticaseibacillus chiayiensis]UYN56908.1 ABC transporter ATP-binding protein [Lacticaseibacillus chiayiensis]
MRDAWRYYWFQAQVDATTAINGLIYFLRRIPFLGKKIPTRWYRTGALKSLLAILVNFMMLLTKPVITMLGIGMAFLVGNAYNDFIRPLPAALSLRLMVAVAVYLLGCLMVRGLIFRYASINIKTIKLGNYFSLDRVGLVHGTLLINQIIGVALGPFFPLFILTLITRNPWLLLVGLEISALSWQWQAFLPRLVWSRRQMGLSATIIYWVSLWGVVAGVTLTGQLAAFVSGIFSFWGFMICLAALLAMAWYVRRFSDDIPFLMASIQQATMALDKVAASRNQQFLAAGKAMQKKLTIDTDSTVKPLNRSGSNYLNALLFARYRQQLWKKLRTRLLWIGGIGGGLIVVLKLFAVHSVGDLTSIYGALFFPMYLSSLGAPIVQLLFVNCDSAMLYYPFYRQPKTILAGFFYRFWRIVQYNAISGGLVFALIFALQIVGPIPDAVNFYLVLLLEVCGMVLFFSFHDLFIYYLIQPFTDDMSVVSPLYRFLYWGMYWVAWVFTQVHFSGYAYAILIGVVTLVYVAIGTAVIYRVAPKTFRIRY